MNTLYNEIMQTWIPSTKAKEDIDKFVEYIEHCVHDNTMLMRSLKDLQDWQKEYNVKINQLSFINFVRYTPFLFDNDVYKFKLDNTSINADETIRIRLVYKKSINLVLHFRKDFVISYLITDNDSNHGDNLVFSMHGTFSSSSKLEKSWKIVRLLNVILADKP